ncbi:MAG: sensor histidine kinase [Bacteroidia bacterium]
MVAFHIRHYVAGVMMALWWTCGMAQSVEKDSLKNLLLQANRDPQVDTYLTLAESWQKTDVDSSYFFLTKAYDLAFESGQQEVLAKINNARAIHWFFRGETDSAQVYITFAMEQASDQPSLIRVTTYSHYGLILAQQGQYNAAAQWHIKALEDATTLGDSLSMIRAQNNLGRVYQALDDIDHAMNWYNHALRLSKSLGADAHSAKILGNMGQIMLTENRLEEAYRYQKDALQIFDRLNDDFSRSITLMDLGQISQMRHLPDTARWYYNHSLALSRRIRDEIGIIYTLANIASLESERGNYFEALTYLDTALRRSQEQSFPEGIKFSYEGLAETYTRMGDYPKAMEYHLLYDQWRDSLASRDYLETIRELETKYRSEQQQNEIYRLSELQRQQTASIQARDDLIMILVFAGLLVLIVAIFGFVFFQQHSQMQQQQKVFSAISETEVAERTRIARDLHDSVGAMLATAHHHLSGMENIFANQPEKRAELSGLLKKISEESRQIAHNLMPETLSRFGLVPAVESLIARINSGDRLNIQILAHGMGPRLPANIELHLFRIIQELLQNVIKHADGASRATLYLTRYPRELTLMLEDNGRGFLLSEAPAGMGLSNVRNRVNLLGGTFVIDSGPGQGATISLTIPIPPVPIRPFPNDGFSSHDTH